MAKRIQSVLIADVLEITTCHTIQRLLFQSSPSPVPLPVLSGERADGGVGFKLRALTVTEEDISSSRASRDWCPRGPVTYAGRTDGNSIHSNTGLIYSTKKLPAACLSLGALSPHCTDHSVGLHFIMDHYQLIQRHLCGSD